MSRFLSKFLYVLKDKQRALLLMVLLFIFVSFLEVLGIGMVGPFIALATNPSSISQNSWLSRIYTQLNFSSSNQFLMTIGGLVVGIFYLKSFLSFKAQQIIFSFGFRQQGELATRLTWAYLTAPYTFHLSRNSAGLIRNIVDETSQFSNSLMMPLLTSIANALVVLAIALLLIQTSTMATVIIGGIFILAFALFQGFKDNMSFWGRQSSEALTAMARLINHGLGGIKETRVIGCEAYFTEQLRVESRRYATNATLGLSFSNLPRYSIEAFLITFLVAFTFLFIRTNHGNTQNLSAVLGIFALASIRLLPAASNLASAINGIRYTTYVLDKLYFDLKELEAAGTTPFQAGLPEAGRIAFHRSLALDSVSYSYPNTARSSLNQISITLKKGESIGLIGKSGAGKTTLVDVILGLLTPQSGDILVDGVSIYGNLRSWQNMIGYVPQSIFLIDDTLERNIAFGVPDHLIDQSRLQKAIQASQLAELVEQLPDRLDTMVGERGVMLSGGQRQRVGIARALYHEREILVFDEATAALDNETEQLVTESIKALTGIKTMIIIAHRLSTIEHCDQVYMLEGGRLAKSGKYDEVVPGKYNLSKG